MQPELYFTQKTHIPILLALNYIIISQNDNIEQRSEAPPTADDHPSGFPVAGLIAFEGIGNEPNNDSKDWVCTNFDLYFNMYVRFKSNCQ